MKMEENWDLLNHVPPQISDPLNWPDGVALISRCKCLCLCVSQIFFKELVLLQSTRGQRGRTYLSTVSQWRGPPPVPGLGEQIRSLNKHLLPQTCERRREAVIWGEL